MIVCWNSNQPPSRSGRVLGNGNTTSSSFRGAPPPKRHLFLSRVDPIAEEAEIRDHINSIGIIDYELTLISHETAPFKSFKLVINLPDMDIAMSPNNWPRDVCIQRFRERVIRDQHLNH